MAKRALPLLTGGLNDVARSDLIDDTQLQECLNYEITGDGILKKRTEQSTFDTGLNTRLDELFSDVLSVSEPYYFVTDIDLTNSNGYTLSSDYIILAFGFTSDEKYEMHTLYKVGETWTNAAQYAVGGAETTLNTLLTDAGIAYSGESDVQFVNSDDRIIITDNVNNAHFVTIDVDGLFRAGKLGMPAPTNKARVSELTEWDDDLFEETSTNTRLSQIGLFQCTYTAVTKSGDESNPAPLSDTLDMQFFKIDANGADERWIDKVSITDLAVPDISEIDLEDLKYFKVYMRVMRYSAGEEIQTLDLTEQFEIIDKSSTFGTTGNNYILTVEVSPGNTANYENDVAPISKTAASLGGITMVGNVQTRINFPHEFKYYHPIAISNEDNKHYVDAVVKIRLWDKDSDDVDAIENFSVGDFISSSDAHKNNKHIRMYDEDSTTPIMVCYKQGESSPNEYLDLYIKVPLLVAGSSHIVYLCWTNEANMNDYDGVPDVYNSSISGDYTFDGNLAIHYGKIMVIGRDSWSRQQVWVNSRVRNTSALVVTPREFTDDEGNALNKANTNLKGTLTDIESSTDYLSTIPTLGSFTNYKIGRFSYKTTTDSSSKIIYDMLYTDSSSNTASSITLNKGFISATITFDLSELSNLSTLDGNRIGAFFVLVAGNTEGNAQNRITLGLRGNGESDEKFTWTMTRHKGSSVSDNSFIDLPVYYESDSGVKTYNVFWSWDFDGLKSILVLYDTDKDFSSTSSNAGIVHSEITGLQSARYQNSDEDSAAVDYRDAVITQLIFGKSEFGGSNRAEVPNNTYVDNLIIDKGEYINNTHQVYQLWNFKPMYENPIGYNWDEIYNNNIDFDETKEIKYKSNRNMVKWTDVNGKSFPDLFFKKVREPVIKIMPAPSFLQFEYQNTFIIFTRNSINRFVLQGSASGWSGSSNSLIEEKQQYGLLSEKSLVSAGDALLWLSEVGVIKWDREGLNLITKNIVDVPIKSSLFGYYVPLNNQYVLHDTSDAISYVYHIDRNAWTKFSGLDVKQSVTLTGGSQLENINLYLKENSPSIDSYPTDTYTTNDSNIKTKNMFFEKGTLKRMKADYTGDSKELQSIVENMVGAEKTHSVSSASEEWRGVPLGKNRGKSVSFNINNADTISAIMYELDIESEVKV